MTKSTISFLICLLIMAKEMTKEMTKQMSKIPTPTIRLTGLVIS